MLCILGKISYKINFMFLFTFFLMWLLERIKLLMWLIFLFHSTASGS